MAAKSGASKNKNKADKEKKAVLTGFFGRIQSQLTQGRGRLITFGVLIFAFYMILQLKYVYDVWFDPDELDIYTVAFEMVKGKVLYRDIASQHMPFTYIYSAIFYILGAKQVYLQRIYYYILFAGFWTGFVFRYRKYVNKWALVLHPLLYLTLMQVQDFSTQILSENLSIIGIEIFALEFIRFLKEKDIDTKGCILMCIGVMFTFGTSFISIFPLFFVGLGVLLTEIKWGIEKHQPQKDWWLMMIKRYFKLFGIVAIPWVIFLIYGLATKSLGSFYMDAYLINRLYYPKYNGGIGGGAAGTFLQPITDFANAFFDIKIKNIEPTFALRWITLLTGVLYFPYRLAKKNGVISGLTMAIFALSCGLRGYFNYHGKVLVALISMFTMIVLVEYTYHSKDSFSKAGLARKGFLATTVVLIFANYSYNINNLFTIILNSEYNHYQYDTDYVLTLTDEDERIWQTNMCDAIPWASKRVTTGPSVSCPWMWEGVGINKMDDLRKNPPRVIMFQLGYESWGHKMSEYAPEAYQFILDNYRYMPDSGQIWVLNSYYDEACRKLGLDPATLVNDGGMGVTPYEVKDNEKPGAKVIEDNNDPD
ncbi:MAG: hypothetical protein K6B68_01025 [Eubacterium sp.]|nr:hypothetical protein [Eubacterium sp.]